MKFYVSVVFAIGIVVGCVLLLIGVGIILIMAFIKRKKQKQNIELNEDISKTQKKRESVVIESVQNTITSFDETNTNTTTLSTYQPGIHSSQINKSINKQAHSLFFTQTFDI
jgi:flagellar biogenesis protein FliO